MDIGNFIMLSTKKKGIGELSKMKDRKRERERKTGLFKSFAFELNIIDASYSALKLIMTLDKNPFFFAIQHIHISSSGNVANRVMLSNYHAKDGLCLQTAHHQLMTFS